MAPILPGLSDRPEQLAEVVRAARAAGACGVWANVLYLKSGTREHFLAHLADDWPELLPHYERLYGHRSSLSRRESSPTIDAVRQLARFHGLRDRRANVSQPPARETQLSLL
jgi:DNA repair photolyase